MAITSLLAAGLTFCAPVSHPAPGPAAASGLAVPTQSFGTLAEAEPSLVALEDRRAFDRGILESAAASRDAAVRARAALALGRIGDERAAPSLRRLLDDASPDVRASAAFAAGILGEPGLTPDLAARLADPDVPVAARAAWAIGLLGQPVGEGAIEAAVPAAAEPERKAALLRALWRFPTPGAAAAARSFAADPEGRIRAAALYALARRPQEGSLAALTAAVEDPDAAIAASAARALGLLGHEESIPVLLAALDGMRHPVAVQAMLAVAAILDKKPGAALPPDRSERLLALSGDADPNLAAPALVLLRWLAADREVFRRLWSLASTGAGRRRQIALQSAVAALGEGADPLVDAAMESADRFLRAAAAESLARLPESDAAPRRQRLASDAEALVRLKVLEGLPTDESVRESRALIEGALTDPDAGVRAAALEPLARLAEPDTLGRMREIAVHSAGEREPDVAIAALEQAKKQPRSAEARAVAEALYAHPSVLVSRLARRSLVRTFHADPAAFPWREYVTGRSVADYAAALDLGRKPWIATVSTERGSFVIRFDGAAAPLTVANFVRLAQRGFFDGAAVHRVVPNFVLQDGDPTATGNGGPGYEIRDELNPLPYEEGTVGMALAGPDTGGSQWFVAHSPQPHLDGAYTAFGRVVSGMDVVKRVEQDDRILRVTVSSAAR